LIAQANYYANQHLSVLLESPDSITLILFVPIFIGTAVNSICLRTCISFCVSLVSQSGCKSRKLISNRQMFFEVFLENFHSLFLQFIYQSINELSLFCGVQM